MSMEASYQPLVELTRGRIVESIHFGAIAVVDKTGKLVASYGDPQTVTFLRSSAKPFQALPFVERGGDLHFGFSSQELALICASHSGTEEHVRVVRGMQTKIGAKESDLLCGTHEPYDKATAEAMRCRGEVPTPNHHNCSGKHTGMLAHAQLRKLPLGEYLASDGFVQKSILDAFAAMAELPVETVEVGIDGCSAPNFAVPLYNAALAFAKLCDPSGLSPEREAACRRITSAMMTNPFMVGGPARFDTGLMETMNKRVIAKAGAEGYQAMGLMPGALGPNSPALGIAMKISDGDPNSRSRPLTALAILKQLGAIDDDELRKLAQFGAQRLTNWRGLEVGESRTNFTLHRD